MEELPRGLADTDLVLWVEARDGAECASVFDARCERWTEPDVMRFDAALKVRAEKAREAGDNLGDPDLGRDVFLALPDAVQKCIRTYLDTPGESIAHRLVVWLAENSGTHVLPWEDLTLEDTVVGEIDGQRFEHVDRHRPVATDRLAVVRYYGAKAGARDPIAISAQHPLRVLVVVGDVDQDPNATGAGRSVRETVAALVRVFERGDARRFAKLEIAASCKHIGSRGVDHELRDDPAGVQSPRTATQKFLDRLEYRRGFHVVLFVGHSDAADGNPSSDLDAWGLRFPFAKDPIDATEIAKRLDRADTRLVILCNCRIGREFTAPILASVADVVGMGATVRPELTESFCKNLLEPLIQGSVPTYAIGTALAVTRVDLPDEHDWIPVHWTRDLRDRALVDPDACARAQFAARTAKLHDVLPAALLMDVEEGDTGLLTEIYVELEAQPKGGASRRERPTLAWVVEQTSVDDAWFTGRYLLLAEPGGGKSTVLKRLAITLAQHPDHLLPVYVPLQDLLDGRITTLQQLANQHEELRDRDRALDGVRLALLLDALDEVSDPELAKRTILALAGQLGRGVLVVASRKDEFRAVFPPEFRTLELQALGENQQEELVGKWCEAFWRSRAAFPGAQAWTSAADGTRQALAAIHRTRACREVARNPLGVTLFVRLLAENEPGTDLPATRADLYRSMLACLIARSHRPDTPHATSLAPDVVEAAFHGLRATAWWLTRSGRPTVRKPGPGHVGASPWRELLQAVEATAFAPAGAPWWKAAEFLEAMGMRGAGVFVAKGANAFGFAIKPFQDLLTAQALAQDAGDLAELERRVRELWDTVASSQSNDKGMLP
ncbi:MAG: hypothetical protein KDC87_16190 [Planctomycetes bacterium]|nr:hypothetical protein [Planctomycetota bacterium]